MTDQPYIRNLNEDPLVPSDEDEFLRGVMDAEHDRSSLGGKPRPDWFTKQSDEYRRGYASGSGA